MKKLSILFVIIILIQAIFHVPALSEEDVITSGDYQYVLMDDGTIQITYYYGETTVLEIPCQLDGHTVSSIGDGAFGGCCVTEVIIPDVITSIGNWAFNFSGYLHKVTIPDSVVSIGINPFRYCPFLDQIVVSPENPVFTTIDGVLFNKLEKRLISYPNAFTAEKYTIPQGVVSIGDCAFYNCELLTEITIPDSVTSIEFYAFYDCNCGLWFYGGASWHRTGQKRTGQESRREDRYGELGGTSGLSRPDRRAPTV